MFVAQFSLAMKTNVLVVLSLFLFTSAAWGQTEVSASLDALMKDATQKNVFSGNVLIEQDGKTVYEKSTGMADYEANRPNAVETRFSIGSITKLFTRIMVLQLVTESKLSLTDKLGKYLSGFRPEIAEKVTVAHLLNHQSGFGQYYDVPTFDPMEASVTNSSDFLPWLLEEELAFEPGTQLEYSNSGYVALGAIIEKLEGKNYAEVLQTRILDKIGMTNTGFLFRMKNLPGKSKGYLSNQPGPLQDNLGFALLGGGDGGIYATTHDLLLLAQSLAGDNRLLSDADKVRLVNEPLFPKRYTDWAEYRIEGSMAIAGGGPGVSAVLGINMAKNRTVIVFSNFDGGSAEALFKRIEAILNGQSPAPLQPSLGIFLYNLLVEKGATYFSANIEQELGKNGYNLDDDDMPLLFAGQPLLAEGKADEAIALYQFYTTKFPRIVVAWNDLGDAYLLKKDKENAKKCYQKALELRPGNQRAQENLKLLLN